MHGQRTPIGGLLVWVAVLLAPIGAQAAASGGAAGTAGAPSNAMAAHCATLRAAGIAHVSRGADRGHPAGSALDLAELPRRSSYDYKAVLSRTGPHRSGDSLRAVVADTAGLEWTLCRRGQWRGCRLHQLSTARAGQARALLGPLLDAQGHTLYPGFAPSAAFSVDAREQGIAGRFYGEIRTRAGTGTASS